MSNLTHIDNGPDDDGIIWCGRCGKNITPFNDGYNGNCIRTHALANGPLKENCPKCIGTGHVADTESIKDDERVICPKCLGAGEIEE